MDVNETFQLLKRNGINPNLMHTAHGATDIKSGNILPYNKAFHLYCFNYKAEQESLFEISDTAQVVHKTLKNWIKKYNWAKRKQEILRKLDEAAQAEETNAFELASRAMFRQVMGCLSLLNSAREDFRGKAKRTDITQIANLVKGTSECFKILASLHEFRKSELPSSSNQLETNTTYRIVDDREKLKYEF